MTGIVMVALLLLVYLGFLVHQTVVLWRTSGIRTALLMSLAIMAGMLNLT